MDRTATEEAMTVPGRLPAAIEAAARLVILEPSKAGVPVQKGVEPVLATKTWPVIPAGSIAVVFTADWYGIAPIAPPARLVAVSAAAAPAKPVSPEPSPVNLSAVTP